MSAPRRVIMRGLVLERWRVIAHFRWYFGLGSPKFEFEFRFGWPPKLKEPEWISYEGDPEDAAAMGIQNACHDEGHLVPCLGWTWEVAPPEFTPGSELAEMNEMDAKAPGWDEPVGPRAPTIRRQVLVTIDMLLPMTEAAERADVVAHRNAREAREAEIDVVSARVSELVEGEYGAESKPRVTVISTAYREADGRAIGPRRERP